MHFLAQRALLRPHLRSQTVRSLCFTCRRRLASSHSQPPLPTAGLAKLNSRRLIAIEGPDATKFLQGLVSQNVLQPSRDGSKRPLARTDAFYTAFLNSWGRVLYDAFIYPFRDGTFFVEVDADKITHLMKYLEMHQLRAALTLRELDPHQASVWHAWVDKTLDTYKTALDKTEEQLRSAAAADGSAIILRDPRAPGMGCRILQLNDKPPVVDLDMAEETAYTIHRYLHGVPEGQRELLIEQALPLESNMEYMHGVDFRKGCYVGQELTIRTRHRGITRKRLLPCMVYGVNEAQPSELVYKAGGGGGVETTQVITAGASIDRLTANLISSKDLDAMNSSNPHQKNQNQQRGRKVSAGKWIKGLGNIGLAMCRLEVMTDIRVTDQDPNAPYRPKHEFVMKWVDKGNIESKPVKVKAFVPSWLRAGINFTQKHSVLEWDE